MSRKVKSVDNIPFGNQNMSDMAKKRTLASFIAQNNMKAPKAVKVKLPKNFKVIQPYKFKGKINI